jgi:hypothetical protein
VSVPGCGAPQAGQTLRAYGFGEGDDIAQSRARVARKALRPARVSTPPGAINGVLTGSQTPKAALARAQREAQRALDAAA